MCFAPCYVLGRWVPGSCRVFTLSFFSFSPLRAQATIPKCFPQKQRDISELRVDGIWAQIKAEPASTTRENTDDDPRQYRAIIHASSCEVVSQMTSCLCEYVDASCACACTHECTHVHGRRITTIQCGRCSMHSASPVPFIPMYVCSLEGAFGCLSTSAHFSSGVAAQKNVEMHV